MGKEVKNSWGTVGTNDQFIKAKPKLTHGFVRALLKVPLGRAQTIGKSRYLDDV